MAGSGEPLAGPEQTSGVSGRLRLRAVPADEVYRLLGGGRPQPMGIRLHEDYPLADTLDAMAMLVGAHEVMGAGVELARRPAWWIYQVLVADLVVGDVGFHGPPAEGTPRTVEIGYALVAPWRGRGIATRACALILATAWADGAEVVLARADPDNPASQRVLAKNGFRRRADGAFAVGRDAA